MAGSLKRSQRKVGRFAPEGTVYGSTSDHADFAGGKWEFTIDTDKRAIRVHDGATLGGVLLAVAPFDTVTALIADTSLAYANADGARVVAADDYIQAASGGYTYKVAASGASDHHVTTAGGVKLYVAVDAYGFASLAQFGAVLDGATDDLVAINTALAAGHPLTGEGLSAGVSGEVVLPASAHLADVTIVALSQALTGNVLSMTDVDGVTLRRVTVDINGDGTNGGGLSGSNAALNARFGVNIDGGQHHMIEDLTVTGSDSCTMLRFEDLDNTSKVIRPAAHTGRVIYTGGADDVLQGIIFVLCMDLEVINPRVWDLQWKEAAGSYATRFTRGIVQSGCERMRVLDAYSADCDQCIDLTGDTGNGNIDCTYIAPRMIRGLTLGFKMSNWSFRNTVFHGVAKDCGQGDIFGAGFRLEAGSNTTQDDRDANKILHCTAINTGASTNTATAAGFYHSGSSYTYDTPAKYIGCLAIDDRGGSAEMEYGFYCDRSGAQDILVEIEDCESEGHTTGAHSGFHWRYCHSNLSTDPTITTATVTKLGYDNDVEDSSAMHDPTSDSDEFHVCKPGIWTFRAMVIWQDATDTTYREIRLTAHRAAGNVTKTANMAAINGADTYMGESLTSRMALGDYFNVQVKQSSGGNVNVRGAAIGNTMAELIWERG